MVPTKYDPETIEQLLRKFAHLTTKKKWKEIGAEFGKSGAATHRWYYRYLAEQKVHPPVEVKNTDVPVDTIRTVYFLLFNKACRIGYYHAITEIRELLETL